MNNILSFPVLIFAVSLVTLWLSAQIGLFFRGRLRPLEEDEQRDLGVVLGATLTLLGLLIAFSFSMATGRYDQRKNREEEEANAIGTEYVRSDLLSAADSAKVRELLRSYLDERVLFYKTSDERRLGQINTNTARLQNELWSIVQAAAAERPAPTVALAVSGMNDVLNAQGYTQAALWNRIPVEAWILMAAISSFCNLLVGYSARRKRTFPFFILPLGLSISFLLIADIDCPRGGLIRVSPRNLVSLSQSLHAH
jgi:hypothetical protein